MMTHDLALGAVVVGVDGRECTDTAVDWAVEDAQRRGRPLLLLAADDEPYPEAVVRQVAVDRGVDVRRVLDTAASRVQQLAPSLELRRLALTDSPVDALVAVSATADSLVVGSHRRGRLGVLLLGSTALQVAAHATCPVVVVRSFLVAPEITPRVVVGVDGSPVSAEAIGYAFAQAAARDVGLTVVHAWHPEYAGGVVPSRPTSETWRALADEEMVLTRDSVSRWEEKYPDVDVRVHVVRKNPVDALVAEADNAELVVVGSRGWSDVRGLLLGSVSQGVLRRVPTPVAVVRPRPAGAPPA